MAEPEGEWVSTPAGQAEPSSEWTDEPLSQKVLAAPPEPGRRGVFGGVLGVLGLIVVGLIFAGAYRFESSPNRDASDAAWAANMAATPSFKGLAAPAEPSTHISARPVPGAAKPEPVSETPTHWASAPDSGLPQVDLTLASGPLPTYLRVGQALTVDIVATCLATGNEEHGAKDGLTRGGISASMDGHATMSSPTAGADHYRVGAPITLFDKGAVWISKQEAKNELIEKIANPWRKGRVLSLRVVVTPTGTGELTLFVRSTATLRKRPVSSTEGSMSLDQQRLPAQVFHLTVTE